MNYSISQQDSIQIVAVQDLLNEFDNNQILNEIETHVNKGLNKLVIDLSRLNFMNSVGLNFLITLMASSKKKGLSLAKANPSKQVIQLLEMTKLTPFFKLRSSLEDALSAVSEN